jgi:predicted DNA-binding transcriptional regulator AlpA
VGFDAAERSRYLMCRPGAGAFQLGPLKATLMPPSSSNRLCVQDAATYIGLSVSTLNKLRVFGGGPTFLKLGRRVAYGVADLDAWLATKRRRSTSDAGEGVA